MAAPTLVTTVGNVAISNATKTTSLTVQAGDLVVVKAGTADATIHVSTPTGGGLTFAAQQVVENVTNQSNAYVWAAQSPSSQTFTLTVTGTSGNWTYEATVWRNHGGVGQSKKATATATTSLTLTTTGANSAIEVLNVDWNAVNGSSRTWLTSAGAFTESSYQRVASSLAFYAGQHADVGAVASKTVGMSAPSGQRPSLIALEVLAAPVAVTGSLTLTATPLPTQVPPQIRVDVSDTRSPSQGSQITVMRLNPDGTQSPVRTSDGNALTMTGSVGAQAGTVFDAEAPLGQLVSYTSLEWPGVTSAQVEVDSTQDWLVDPGQPTLSMPINLRPGTLQKVTYPMKQGVFYPMARTNAVVQTDGARKGGSSSLVLVTQSKQERAALAAILAAGSVLFLNPGTDSWNFGPAYVAVGDVDETRWTDVVIDDNRDFTLPITVVDRPAGGTQAGRTWADVLADYGSWAAVMNEYRTWADELAGP